MALFNNIPYKCICITSRVNLTKCFSKKYKHVCPITRLYGNMVTKDHIAMHAILFKPYNNFILLVLY